MQLEILRKQYETLKQDIDAGIFDVINSWFLLGSLLPILKTNWLRMLGESIALDVQMIRHYQLALMILGRWSWRCSVHV